MRAISLVLVLVLTSGLLATAACGKSKTAAPVDPAPTLAAVRALADRVCACNNDAACVKYVRADWDAGKRGWLEARKRFPATTATVFDADAGRMRACGDAAGLTFWLEL